MHNKIIFKFTRFTYIKTANNYAQYHHNQDDHSSIHVLIIEPLQRTHDDCVKTHKLLSKLKCFNSFNHSIQSQLCQQAILIEINDKNVLLYDND